MNPHANTDMNPLALTAMNPHGVAQAPSLMSSLAPSLAPGLAPSMAPSLAPGLAPSMAPSLAPGLAPSLAPTLAPTLAPRLASSLSSIMAPILACVLALVAGSPSAASPIRAGSDTPAHADPVEPTPNLPPAAIVDQVLRANPGIRAADKQVPVARAKGAALEAGDYEWTLLVGGQQRRVNPDVGDDQRFQEWNTDLQRQVRLPGKATLDRELGALGVEQAERRRADAEHETARDLLKTWFTWLKAGAAVAQWQAEVSLLQKQAKALSRRHQLGDAARLETVQGDAAVAQAEAQLAQAQGRRDQAGADLSRRYPEIPLEEQRTIATPPALDGDEGAWIEAIVQHSHGLGLAQAESRQSRVGVKRAASERWPDPTFGVHLASERDGEENIVGAYVILNLPGGARQAKADAALAEAEVANEREAAALQQVTAEAASLYQTARAARQSWQSAQQAAGRLAQAADMTARAYQLGEGQLEDLLTARRQANEAELAARLSQIEALEATYRLRLDAHRLWDFSGERGQP